MVTLRKCLDIWTHVTAENSLWEMISCSCWQCLLFCRRNNRLGLAKDYYVDGQNTQFSQWPLAEETKTTVRPRKSWSCSYTNSLNLCKTLKKTFLDMPKVRALSIFIEGPCLQAFWDLENTVLQGICVSGTVLWSPTSTNSPTYKYISQKPWYWKPC